MGEVEVEVDGAEAEAEAAWPRDKPWEYEGAAVGGLLSRNE